MSDIEQRVIQIISDVMVIEESVVKNTSSLVNDLNMGSRNRDDLIRELETEFGIDVSKAEAKGFATVQQVIDYIQRELA